MGGLENFEYKVLPEQVYSGAWQWQKQALLEIHICPGPKNFPPKNMKDEHLKKKGKKEKENNH